MKQLLYLIVILGFLGFTGAQGMEPESPFPEMYAQAIEPLHRQQLGEAPTSYLQTLPREIFELLNQYLANASSYDQAIVMARGLLRSPGWEDYAPDVIRYLQNKFPEKKEGEIIIALDIFNKPTSDITYSFIKQVAPRSAQQPTNFLETLPPELQKLLVSYLTSGEDAYEIGQKMRGIFRTPAFLPYVMQIMSTFTGTDQIAFIAGLSIAQVSDALIDAIMQSRDLKSIAERWVYLVLNQWAWKGSQIIKSGKLELLIKFLIDHKNSNGKVITRIFNPNLVPSPNLISQYFTPHLNEPGGPFYKAIESGNISLLRFLLEVGLKPTGDPYFAVFMDINDNSYAITSLFIAHGLVPYNSSLSDLLWSNNPKSVKILRLLLDENKNEAIQLNLEDRDSAANFFINQLPEDQKNQPVLKQKWDLLRDYLNR